MMQQIIALAIIGFFLIRLIGQKNKNAIKGNEFVFWLVFWLASMLAIIFIKPLDRAVAKIGFSASGIDVLLYSSVAVLFYFLIKIRLRLEKIEKNITKISRLMALAEPRVSAGRPQNSSGGEPPKPV